MQHEVVFSGFGGQGVLFAGQLLAYAGMAEGKHVTWIPSYGPEMRGGTANCTVVVADEPVGSPVTKRPGVVVAFNLPSVLKYQDMVKPGGLLVINSSLVDEEILRADIRVLNIPATDTANTLGESRLTNMILFSAMLTREPVIAMQTLKDTLIAKLPARKQHLLDINLQAIEAGIRLAQTEQVAP